METRLATSADIPVLTALHRESFPLAPWSDVQMAQSLALPTTRMWVAMEGVKAQGFIACQVVCDEIEVLTFCVSPICRRNGVGAFLLGGVLNEARKLDIKHAFLDVAASNTAALALYAKQGFTVTGTRARYYADGADAVLMARDIDRRVA